MLLYSMIKTQVDVISSYKEIFQRELGPPKSQGEFPSSDASADPRRTQISFRRELGHKRVGANFLPTRVRTQRMWANFRRTPKAEGKFHSDASLDPKSEAEASSDFLKHKADPPKVRVGAYWAWAIFNIRSGKADAFG